MKQTLNKDEIEFFYNLLYKYEHESHAGYQDKKVLKAIGNNIIIDDKHEKNEIISIEKTNCLQFTPYHNCKCWAILYHVRNSFAHGNIQSIEKDTTFLIRDYSDKGKRTKCNMLGIVKKSNFYELIDAIEKTKKTKR